MGPRTLNSDGERGWEWDGVWQEGCRALDFQITFGILRATRRLHAPVHSTSQTTAWEVRRNGGTASLALGMELLTCALEHIYWA